MKHCACLFAAVAFCLPVAAVDAVSTMSADTRARYRAAVAAIESGDAADAERVLRTIVDRHPNPDLSQGYRPYYELARVRLQLGDYAGAELSLAISEGLMPAKPKRKIRQSVEQLRVELEQGAGH